jgi:hypothetical protein
VPSPSHPRPTRRPRPEKAPAPLMSRHHDPPPRGQRRVFIRGHHHHVRAARASPGLWLQFCLGRLSSRSSVLPRWQRRSLAGAVRPTPPPRRPCQPLLNLRRQRLGARRLGRGSEGMTRALWAKCFRGVRLSTPVSSYL